MKLNSKVKVAQALNHGGELHAVWDLGSDWWGGWWREVKVCQVLGDAWSTPALATAGTLHVLMEK